MLPSLPPSTSASGRHQGSWRRSLPSDPPDGGHRGPAHFAERLGRAILKGELELAYQPIVELETGAIEMVEALVRWNDPELGPVASSWFIPFAEGSGQIIDLGRWVLTEAATQASEWARQGLPVRVAVNASPFELQDSGYADAAVRVIEAAGANPAMLTVEVTESGAASGQGHLLDTVRRLRALGVRVSIDDFGSGQSSLGRLAELPADELKLDRSFLRQVPDDPRAEVIVWSVLNMAAKLGMDVVAEGVESGAQALFLLASGCRLAQGFHLGRPETPSDVTERLRRPRQVGPASAPSAKA